MGKDFGWYGASSSHPPRACETKHLCFTRRLSGGESFPWKIGFLFTSTPCSLVHPITLQDKHLGSHLSQKRAAKAHGTFSQWGLILEWRLLALVALRIHTSSPKYVVDAYTLLIRKRQDHRPPSLHVLPFHLSIWLEHQGRSRRRVPTLALPPHLLGLAKWKIVFRGGTCQKKLLIQSINGSDLHFHIIIIVSEAGQPSSEAEQKVVIRQFGTIVSPLRMRHMLSRSRVKLKRLT